MHGMRRLWPPGAGVRVGLSAGALWVVGARWIGEWRGRGGRNCVGAVPIGGGALCGMVPVADVAAVQGPRAVDDGGGAAR